MSDENAKNAGGSPPEAAPEESADAGHATGAMTPPPQATPRGSFPRTAKIVAAEAPPPDAVQRPVPGTALMQQPVLRTTHDADPSTLRDAHPPWQRPGNTEVGEPPIMDTVPPAAPPAPLAPPVAFAPLPAPNVPMGHATPPINAAPPAYGAPAYNAPRRARGNGMLLIGAGLFGFVLLLGTAIAIVLWMQNGEDQSAPALTSSAPPAQVAPEVATVEPQVTPEPPAVAAPVEPAPQPKPAARKPRVPATATPAATPDTPALPAPPVETAPAQTAPPEAPAPPPAATETSNPPPAETLPPTPAPRRRVPRRIGQ